MEPVRRAPAEPRMEGDCWQLVVPRAATRKLLAVLGLMNLEIFPMPSGVDDLPTYGITFVDSPVNPDIFRELSLSDGLRLINLVCQDPPETEETP